VRFGNVYSSRVGDPRGDVFLGKLSLCSVFPPARIGHPFLFTILRSSERCPFPLAGPGHERKLEWPASPLLFSPSPVIRWSRALSHSAQGGTACKRDNLSSPTAYGRNPRLLPPCKGQILRAQPGSVFPHAGNPSSRYLPPLPPCQVFLQNSVPNSALFFVSVVRSPCFAFLTSSVRYNQEHTLTRRGICLCPGTRPRVQGFSFLSSCDFLIRGTVFCSDGVTSRAASAGCVLRVRSLFRDLFIEFVLCFSGSCLASFSVPDRHRLDSLRSKLNRPSRFSLVSLIVLHGGGSSSIINESLISRRDLRSPGCPSFQITDLPIRSLIYSMRELSLLR